MNRFLVSLSTVCISILTASNGVLAQTAGSSTSDVSQSSTPSAVSTPSIKPKKKKKTETPTPTAQPLAKTSDPSGEPTATPTPSPTTNSKPQTLSGPSTITYGSSGQEVSLPVTEVIIPPGDITSILAKPTPSKTLAAKTSKATTTPTASPSGTPISTSTSQGTAGSSSGAENLVSLSGPITLPIPANGNVTIINALASFVVSQAIVPSLSSSTTGETPTPTATSFNKNFYLNVGSALINPYQINSSLVTTGAVTQTNMTISKASNTQGIFFFDPVFRDRYSWTGGQIHDLGFDLPFIFWGWPVHGRFLKISEVEFGLSSASSNSTASAVVGSGNLFGEITIDALSWTFHDPGFDTDWAIGGIYGGSTDNLSSQIINYYGFGLESDFGIPIANQANRIEILAALYPFAWTDAPNVILDPGMALSNGPATVNSMNGFADYGLHDTALVKLEFHYPLDQNNALHFLTFDVTGDDHELAFIQGWLGHRNPLNQLDNWSVRIGYSQDVSTLVGALFPNGSPYPATPTPTPTTTPSLTPGETPGTN